MSAAAPAASHWRWPRARSPPRSSASISPHLTSPMPPSRSTDPRLRFATGDAVALDLPEASFDRSFSLLALNFMSDPRRALAAMRRVTGAGGVVAAAVWDFPGGLVYQRIFWDTAAALDPAADLARARHYSSPLTGPGELAAAFHERGARRDRRLLADHPHAIPRLRRLLGADRKRPGAGRRLCQSARAGAAGASGCGGAPRLSRRRPDGPRAMAATAWAARGVVPAATPSA